MNNLPQHPNREPRVNPEGTDVTAGVGEQNVKGKL